MVTVSFADCCGELVQHANQAGRSAFEAWQRRPHYEAVVQFVSNFSHEHLFSLTTADITRTIDSSAHPLGDIKAEEQLEIVEDFTTPFAFQHLFHWFIESQRKVPTWRDYRDWMVDGPAKDYWYLPLKEHLEKHAPASSRDRWSRAARWRLGKVYMSNMREMDLMVRLLEAGVPLRYHLLADVLLRVDFWIRQLLICIYFPNPEYRDGTKGRKPPAAYFFSGTRFEVLDIPIARQGFGKIWRANDNDIREIANKISVKLQDG